MSFEASTDSTYLLSFILATDSYEAELDRQFRQALANSPEVILPENLIIAPAPPNRAWFIESLLDDLRTGLTGLEILSDDDEFAHQIDCYEAGIEDLVEPGGWLHVLALSVRPEQDWVWPGELLIREFPNQDYVLVSFAFPPEARSHLAGMRRMLLTLAEGCPLLLATLGLNLDALLVESPPGAPWLSLPLSLAQLARIAEQPHSGAGYDFIFLAPAATGGDLPLVLDRTGRDPAPEEAPQLSGCRDLDFVGGLFRWAEAAEQAYTRMYDSRRPKDDRDEALRYLSRAAELATSLGLTEEAGNLRERSTHIETVYNHQFRHC